MYLLIILIVLLFLNSCIYSIHVFIIFEFMVFTIFEYMYLLFLTIKLL